MGTIPKNIKHYSFGSRALENRELFGSSFGPNPSDPLNILGAGWNHTASTLSLILVFLLRRATTSFDRKPAYEATNHRCVHVKQVFLKL